VNADTLPEAAREALADARWAERAGLRERAVAAYRRVAELCPDRWEIHATLARLLLALDEPREALRGAQQALALQPDDVQVNADAGQALLRLGDDAGAVPYLRRALQGQPDHLPLRRRLADALLRLGRREEAVAVFGAVLERHPDDVEVLKTVASVLHRAGAGPLAEQAYRRILALAPGRAETWNELALLYVDMSEPSRAREVALEGLEANPAQPALWNTLALAQASLGQVPEALASYRQAMTLAPGLATSHSNLLLTMHYSTDVAPGEIAAEHRRWGRQHAPPHLATRVFANPPEPSRRLRVGFVSPNFQRHSVAFFFESLLDHRDPRQVEVYCYADLKFPDEVTGRIRDKADHFRTVSDLDDTRVMGLIKADAIDVLVDLAGHAGSSRITLLGRKPAPVQVTWCGYPDTTGIEAVDYRITDWLADPAGAEDYHTERLCRLPGPFLCFRPPVPLPELGPPPCAGGGPVTFGSFNRQFKLSRDTYDLWCRILRALPGSRMVLKSVAGADPGTRSLQLGEFERRGVAPDRIELIGFIPDQLQHLAGYRQVDITLDTYPYHGTTTTLDALLMGVPVVTLAGYHHASRVGVSLLSHAGLPELIARSPDEYVDLAVGLARDPARIAGLHGRLRQRLLDSPVCDGPAFARAYEYALRGMWCAWCRTQGVALTPAQQAMAAFDFPAGP